MVNRAGLTHWSRQEGLIPSSRGSLAGSPVDDLLHKETGRDSYLKPGLGSVFIAEEWRRRLMDGLTTCCALAGVSGLSVVEVTPRQPIANDAVQAASLHAVTSTVTASPTCDQEIREMRCWPHRRLRRLFACIPCRDENAHVVRCQLHRYVHLLLCSG
ncbi:hypothetical protein Hanom_Chr16g01480621 [Helianthus anomalus]